MVNHGDDVLRMLDLALPELTIPCDKCAHPRPYRLMSRVTPASHYPFAFVVTDPDGCRRHYDRNGGDDTCTYASMNKQPTGATGPIPRWTVLSYHKTLPEAENHARWWAEQHGGLHDTVPVQVIKPGNIRM